MAAQWPCVCLQGLWQKVQPQQQHPQTQEACDWQASPQEELLPLLHVGQGGEEEEEEIIKEEGRHPLPNQKEIYYV